MGGVEKSRCDSNDHARMADCTETMFCNVTLVIDDHAAVWLFSVWLGSANVDLISRYYDRAQ